jgi:hypothetical protein
MLRKLTRLPKKAREHFGKHVLASFTFAFLYPKPSVKSFKSCGMMSWLASIAR